MERPSEHMEHFEHQQHAALDPFDKRVAMTMAIVAASLACMTMLGHRAHNETLRSRIEASDLRTQAGDKHTQAANQWAFYQAKNIRDHDYKRALRFLEVLARETSPKAADLMTKTREDWEAQVKKYEKDLPRHESDARGLDAEAQKMEEQARESLKQSDHYHHLGTNLDLSELGVELSLVLCSLAVLTKRRPFWYFGILSGALGVGFGLYSYGLHLLH